MRVYEAIVKALESVGVDAAFGGAGENAAGAMIALKHSTKIRPVIVRHEQAAAFMACGYAIYTNRLGVCFATAGPGGFNLFSGLAVAMSDSYPVLAITGYSRLVWKGKGALNETSGESRTPDSQAMFAATTKRSFFLDDISKTCDVVEEAVNLAFEGRPGPVHIHVPEDLTLEGQTVDNYRDIKLVVKPVLPVPAQIAAAAAAIAAALRQNKSVIALIGFGAVRSGAGPELQALRRAIPDSVRHHARRQGHHCRRSSARARRILRQRPCRRRQGFRRGRPGDRCRQFVCATRDLQFPRRPADRKDARPHQHLGAGDRQSLSRRPRRRRRRQARGRGVGCRTVAAGQAGRAGDRDQGPAHHGAAHQSRAEPCSPRPAHASAVEDAARRRHRAGGRRRASRLARLLPAAQGRPALPQAGQFWADGLGGERRARHQDGVSRPAGHRRLRRRLLSVVRFRADDRGPLQSSRHLDHLP